MKKTEYVKDKNTGVVFLAKNVEMSDDYEYISKEEFDSYVDPHWTKEN
jgi:hypothetical protein